MMSRSPILIFSLILSFAILDHTVNVLGFTPSIICHTSTLTRKISSIAPNDANSFKNLQTRRRVSSKDKEPVLENTIETEILEKFNEYHSNEDKTYTERDILRFEMEEFKPLGCTAEESLFVREDGSKHVFVSKVVKGSNAKKAGFEVGDVIVGVSGSFEAHDVVSVVGESLERVKSLIGGRGDGQGLVIIAVRGSDVMAKHESTLVDLCILPDNDKDVEKCIESMYQAEYDMKTDTSISDDDKCDDENLDCMLDTLFDVWADEVGIKKEGKEEEVKEVKKKPAPWSSRSSPSGTYVRDPKTGKMVNIDE